MKPVQQPVQQARLVSSPKLASVTNKEYQELLHRIARQNEVLNSIKAQISICKDSIPKTVLNKLMMEC